MDPSSLVEQIAWNVLSNAIVFEIFRRAGGLGIGLALVRSPAQPHGGRVAAESESPGRGATFKV